MPRHERAIASTLVDGALVLLVLIQLASALTMTRLDGGRTVGDWTQWHLYRWHKSVGLVVLLLALLRLGAWILGPRWRAGTRRGVRLALTLCLVALPVTGYVAAAAGGYGVTLFGLEVPNWVGFDDTLAAVAQDVHRALVIVLGTLATIWLVWFCKGRRRTR